MTIIILLSSSFNCFLGKIACLPKKRILKKILDRQKRKSALLLCIFGFSLWGHYLEGGNKKHLSDCHTTTTKNFQTLFLSRSSFPLNRFFVVYTPQRVPKKKMVATTRRSTTARSSGGIKNSSKSSSSKSAPSWQNPGLKREFLSAFSMAFGMLFVPMQKNLFLFLAEKLISMETKEMLKTRYANEIIVALLFINLQFYFGPIYGRFSKGSCNNPTVYILRGFMGEISFAEAFNGAMVVVVAHIAAFMAYFILHVELGEEILPAGSPVIAVGSQREAVTSEAVVAFLNFLAFDFAAKTMPKGVQPAFGALFYCIVITVEKCKYSCGYMNPAVVLASHVVWGQTMMKSKKIFSIERILEAAQHEANRPYVYGAVLGSLTTAVVAKAIDMATSVSSSGVVNGSKKSSSSSTTTKQKKKKAETTTKTRSAGGTASSLRKRK